MAHHKEFNTPPWPFAARTGTDSLKFGAIESPKTALDATINPNSRTNEMSQLGSLARARSLICFASDLA